MSDVIKIGQGFILDDSTCVVSKINYAVIRYRGSLITLMGIYDDMEKAEQRKSDIECHKGEAGTLYWEVKIIEAKINQDIEESIDG